MANVILKLLGDEKDLVRALKRSSREAKEFQRDIRGVGSSLDGLAKGAALGGLTVGLAAVGIAARAGFNELKEARRVAAQTGAVLKSTGGIAGVTAEQVDRLAQSLLRKTGIDDEAIKSGQNLLLTFTNIRNVAGDGNDIYNQASVAILDFATATGTDATAAALALGKALQDPIRGITALRRRGVAFSAQQVGLIKTMVKSGNTMGAQKLILAELSREFGGSAEAVGQADGGIAILQQTFLNFTGVLVEKFMPAIENATARLQKWLDNPANTDKIVRDVEETAGAFAGLVGSLNEANTKGNQAMDFLRKGVESTAEGLRVTLLKPLTVGPFSTWAKRERAESLAELKALAAGSNAIFETLTEGARNAPDNRATRPVGVPRGVALPPGTPGGRGAAGVTAAQRNRWFDTMIGRREDRVQDVKNLEGQIASLGRIATLIRERLAITKDITRRQKLEDELLDIGRQQAGLREQIKQNTLEAQRLALDKKREAILKEQDRVALALATLKERTQARQFRSLGLAADGSEVVPGVKNLRKQLGQFTDTVKGTFLDTDKTKSLMGRIRKVLSGGFGAVSRDVRSTIASMLDDIRKQLGEFKGPLTKTSGLDTSKLVAGLGLSPEQIRAIRSRTSGFNSAGLAIAGGASARGGGFVGGRPIVVESHVTVQADGHTLGKVATRSQQKNRRRNPQQRRGPNRPV